MRRPIAVLAPEVAERIAAGEVVERPASVVRELVDNALDAGATAVTIELRGGGLELIRVSDDGGGIPPEEIELAFQHHATNKIGSLDDLAQLRTLGFRGEALPSIAAVSDVELVTHDEDHDVGTLVRLRNGQVVRRGQVARQRGTTVTVRHLFANVPARLKFLVAGRGESLLVGNLARRYALAHPSSRFTLVLDGRVSFRSTGDGRLATAIADVYGPAVAASALSLGESRVDGTVVSGLVSGRGTTRPGRDHLTLVVNGRWVQCRALLTALENAYRPLLPRGRHPIAVVRVDVPPDELDPNVHPAKTEVRLAREAEVAAALADAVRGALARAPVHASSADDFTLEGGQLALTLTRRYLAEGPGAAWGESPEAMAAKALRVMRILGQVQESLILAEGPTGLFLIDQHRAHERIIYEKLRPAQVGATSEAQTLLEPVVLELKPHQARLLDERLSELDELGFSCERIGGRHFLVRAVPVAPGSESFLADLQFLLEEAAAPEDDWRGRLFAGLSCRAAVRRNRPLAPLEMTELLRDLAETSAPAVCPHGSPLILHVSRGFLKKQFGW